MYVSLIVKSKYKGSVRDYMTLDQFATYISTGKQPLQTWGEVKQKGLAIKKKKRIMPYSFICNRKHVEYRVSV